MHEDDRYGLFAPGTLRLLHKLLARGLYVLAIVPDDLCNPSPVDRIMEPSRTEDEGEVQEINGKEIRWFQQAGLTKGMRDHLLCFTALREERRAVNRGGSPEIPGDNNPIGAYQEDMPITGIEEGAAE